jgi:hypothetical protein
MRKEELKNVLYDFLLDLRDIEGAEREIARVERLIRKLPNGKKVHPHIAFA